MPNRHRVGRVIALTIFNLGATRARGGHCHIMAALPPGEETRYSL